MAEGTCSRDVPVVLARLGTVGEPAETESDLAMATAQADPIRFVRASGPARKRRYHCNLATGEDCRCKRRDP
jgi:hypothetical protein